MKTLVCGMGTAETVACICFLLAMWVLGQLVTKQIHAAVFYVCIEIGFIPAGMLIVKRFYPGDLQLGDLALIVVKSLFCWPFFYLQARGYAELQLHSEGGNNNV